MSNTFFISDTHFGHKNIHKFEPVLRSGTNFTENANNIITNWNNTVNKRDTVWILGDIAFDDAHLELCHNLNGQKNLIVGNHDDRFGIDKLRKVFKNRIEGTFRYKGHWLSHFPIHPQELFGKLNIHGHVHSNFIRLSGGELDRRYINVSCEAIHETPISFDDIKSGQYWRQVPHHVPLIKA